jgi:phosphatidylserine decarboxylase
VGRIRVVYDEVVSNQGRSATDLTLLEPVPLARAAELGRFELGSTVILLFRRGSVTWTIRPGDVVRVGKTIAEAREN